MTERQARCNSNNTSACATMAYIWPPCNWPPTQPHELKRTTCTRIARPWRYSSRTSKFRCDRDPPCMSNCILNMLVSIGASTLKTPLMFKLAHCGYCRNLRSHLLGIFKSRKWNSFVFISRLPVSQMVHAILSVMPKLPLVKTQSWDPQHFHPTCIRNMSANMLANNGSRILTPTQLTNLQIKGC
jgi:hypothetical protein